MRVETKTILIDDYGNNLAVGYDVVLTLEGKTPFECKIKSIKPKSMEVISVKGGYSVKYTDILGIYLKVSK